ncbi:MAG: ABC transporter permease, partial [Planctomycetota bacterium]
RIQAGHVTIEHPDYLDAPAADLAVVVPQPVLDTLAARPDVQTLRPMVLANGLASTAHGTQGIAIFGVDPAVETTMSPLAQHISDGRYLNDANEKMVVIGRTLADQLELEVGKKLVITTSDMHGEMAQTLVHVAGIFSSGSDDIDGRILQMPIGTARDLLQLPAGAVHRLGIILTYNEAMEPVADATKQALGLTDDPTLVAPGMTVRTWHEVMRELYTFSLVDQGGNWVMQGIMLGLILFIIFNTIYMSVMERQREFAVMLAIGTPPLRLQAQILAESFWIGLLSAIVGLGIGVAGSLAARHYGLDFSAMMEEGMTISGFFMDPVMRPRVRVEVVLMLAAAVLISTVLMGILPARRATRVELADTLRVGGR